jgi:hypothetical protein
LVQTFKKSEKSGKIEKKSPSTFKQRLKALNVQILAEQDEGKPGPLDRPRELVNFYMSRVTFLSYDGPKMARIDGRSMPVIAWTKRIPLISGKNVRKIYLRYPKICPDREQTHPDAGSRSWVKSC